MAETANAGDDPQKTNPTTRMDIDLMIWILIDIPLLYRESY